MTRPGDKMAHRARLTDVSVGGCYVETMSPLAVGTTLQISLAMGRVELYAQGVVETLHPSIGNGIAFTEITPENQRALQSVIDGVTTSAATEEAPPAAQQHELSAEVEALISLLERKSILTRAELLTEFKAKAAAKR